MSDGSILLEVRDLVKTFGQPDALDSATAVDGVSLSLTEGETLGLVGESGSGKTTVARCIIRLTSASAGRVILRGADITDLSGRTARVVRREMQYVFQDPYDSLNPRWRIERIVEEPLMLSGGMSKQERNRRVVELLRLVNLDESFLSRYPRELSGGQRQRIGIARALATEPSLVILDEPTSALDSLTRGDILELLDRLKRELRTTYLFISHDLSAVRRICDRIAVMYLGKIVEVAPTERLFATPKHPYTRSLLSSILEPRVDGRQERMRLSGEPPSPLNVPTGCRLHPRCPVAIKACQTMLQRLEEVERDHWISCMVVAKSRDDPTVLSRVP